MPGSRPSSNPPARLFRTGQLTAICVPDVDDEAMRDLTRSREGAISVERRAKQRTAALLLRHGRRYARDTSDLLYLGLLSYGKISCPDCPVRMFRLQGQVGKSCKIYCGEKRWLKNSELFF